MVDEQIFDFVVIGAGIAGASVAYELADSGSVMLLERESMPGYHSTGRSAALYAPIYGPAPIRALTRASGAFFQTPPNGFCDADLLSPRDVVMIGRSDQKPHIDEFLAETVDAPGITQLTQTEVTQYNPMIRPGYATHGVLDRSGSDIDVNGLHRGFLRAAKQRGAALTINAEVTACSRNGDVWVVATKQGTVRGNILINAAGAWAEQIGQMAGAGPIGLTPKRRSAIMVDAPDSVSLDTMPMTIDIEEDFYIKPDAGQLLLSPANEDPMEPCDAQPDEMDIAICVDRIERAFDISIRRINSKWAGLRSFVADKSPVVGFSHEVDGFMWLAGQGGYGVQSSPAMGRVAAAIAQGVDIPADIIAHGFRPESITIERLSS